MKCILKGVLEISTKELKQYNKVKKRNVHVEEEVVKFETKRIDTFS